MATSDHCPLHLALDAPLQPHRRFRFELFWTKLEGIDEAVEEAWTCDSSITDPFLRLDFLLWKTAHDLMVWGQRKAGNIKLQIAIANWIILHLDRVMDHRVLFAGERWPRNTLKLTSLGLASLERMIARQRSRIHWLAEGDANTKLFHLVANGRKLRNFIPALHHGDVVITEQSGKEEAFYAAYKELLGTCHAREHSIDLEFLGMTPLDLHELDEIYTEEEVFAVVKTMPADRAPGLDGFIGLFFHRAWNIIKGDVMAAIHKLQLGNGRGFGRLNQAIITLIPKKPDACCIGDFRPVSLLHSIPKINAKLMASRLCPWMGEFVSINQSAYIHGRNIHDNSMLVRQVARNLHRRNAKEVMVKLDISQAFDSLSWSFLLEVLWAKGFSELWCSRLVTFLATASSRVLVNGCPGRKCRHVKGLRQGDPVSPLLFIIAMDTLTALVTKAQAWGAIITMPGCSPFQRLSVYADDVILFIRPTIADLSFTREALQLFGTASGLHVNFAKSSAIMIRSIPSKI